MTWKLDLIIVILILAILFMVYLFMKPTGTTALITTTTTTTLTTTNTENLQQATTTTTMLSTTTMITTTTAPTTTTTTTTTTSRVYISGMELNGTTAADEWIEISVNADMTNYTLKDAANHTYTFPDFTMSGSARVHTGAGMNNETDVYWNRSSGVWNNDGDTAFLFDASKNKLDEKYCASGTCWFTS